MDDRTEAEIDDLVARFERQAVSHAEWRHREHLTVALAYLLRLPPDEVVARMTSGIQALNQALDPGSTGYHETLTIAWCRRIAIWLAAQDPATPRATLAARVGHDLPKTALRPHYSHERIHAPEARAGWVPPDKEPLDWPALSGRGARGSDA